MNYPLFSIVIPTRNRAHLLQGSLQSALAQDFDDYEIIVVNNNCQDNTDSIVECLQNSKVKYFKTGQTLSMPDNWEFSWNQATGKYVLYLCDDDALLPNTLSFLADKVLIEKPSVISWQLCQYKYSNWIEPENRNILTIPIQSNTVETYDSGALLEKLYKFEDLIWFPRMLNSCVERQVFEKFRQKLGRIFFQACPDYSLMSIALHLCSELVVVHRPLGILGVSPNSIGAMQRSQGDQGEAAKEFSKEFGDLNLFDGCPIIIPVVPNYIAGTLIRVNSALAKAGIAPQTIDWNSYFIAVGSDLKSLEKSLPDFAKYKHQLMEAASRYSPECGKSVEFSLQHPPASSDNYLRNLIGRIIQANQLLCRIELAIRYKGEMKNSYRFFNLEPGVMAHRSEIIIKGSEVGVSSIADMAKIAIFYLDKYLVNQS